MIKESRYIVKFSGDFEKELKKLSGVDEMLVLRKIIEFEKNPFHPSFRTKKMRGIKDYYESSVNMDIRMIWYFQGNKIIIMMDVGHHDVLRKY
jgi:mRNA-degrading endonuclease YafQ of YafQ-DinJ toxin-antitoxin module